MKTTYVLVATVMMVTLLSCAKAACPDCTQHADGALLRDPTSCSHYYKCIQGRSERKSCGSGFYFDERFLICNFAAFVDCKNPGNLVDPTPATPATPAPTCHHTHHNHQTTCTPTPAPTCKTTTCAPTAPTPAIDQEPCEPIAPAEDPEECDEVTTPACETTPPPCESTRHPHPSYDAVIDTLQRLSDCKSLKDGTYLFDSKHCRRYYVCRGGKARHERCSYGQWFDGHFKTCRSQRYVNNCPANRN